MPVGVQLVGRPHGDGRLLRTARWLWETLEDEGRNIAAVMGEVA
jgi:Asp-tRNA(Asn)/Glu-tRNA(Gln) amidotransferase A subunit family amidase